MYLAVLPASGATRYCRCHGHGCSTVLLHRRHHGEVKDALGSLLRNLALHAPDKAELRTQAINSCLELVSQQAGTQAVNSCLELVSQQAGRAAQPGHQLMP